MPKMEIEERVEGPAAVVYPAGRPDDTGGRVLEARISAIAERGWPVVALDCSRISYIDSTGLHFLLLAHGGDDVP